MELLIAGIILLVLLFILGVSTDILIAGILCVLEIILLLMTAFFILSLCLLLTAKPKKAEFVRIEKSESHGSHAVYRIDGTEYRNLYPADTFMKGLLYRRRIAAVRLWKRGKHAFTLDRYSAAVTALGLPLSAASALGLGSLVIQLVL